MYSIRQKKERPSVVKTAENGKAERKVVKHIIVFFLLTVVCITLSAFCFFQMKNAVFAKHAKLFTVLACVFLCALFALSILFVVKNRRALCKIMISVYVFLIFCLATWLILLQTDFFDIMRDADSLQRYIQSAGAWMPVFYILLQYLQVVVLPIPSLVSTVAGVALFGAFYTMLYSLIGIILGSLTAFIIGRKLGYKAVAWMVGEDALQKWREKLKGKDNFVLTLTFLLPLFPDDILCFVAGLSSMSLGYFTVMVFVCRLLGIATTCYSVELIPFNTWWGICIWGLILLGVILAFIIIYRNLDTIQKWFSKRVKRSKKKK